MTTDTDALEANLRNLERENRELRMTLRDEFAARAMQTLIACVWDRSGDTNRIIDDSGYVSLHLRAYEHADAMLWARKEK